MNSSTFGGFPEAAFDFYDDLEMDNTKSFWEANKATYEAAIRQPMVALTDALADEFGSAKLFRPYRDVRFSKDKAPYKTSQGAYVGVGEGLGWYVQVAASGVRVGSGFYGGSSERIAQFRRGIDDERRGPELQKLLAKLAKAGFELGGEQLKTAPRGFTADHPRIDLLRHKSMHVGADYGFEPIVNGPGLVDKVRKDWRQMRPLVEWLQREFA